MDQMNLMSTLLAYTPPGSHVLKELGRQRARLEMNLFQAAPTRRAPLQSANSKMQIPNSKLQISSCAFQFANSKLLTPENPFSAELRLVIFYWFEFRIPEMGGRVGRRFFILRRMSRGGSPLACTGHGGKLGPQGVI